MYKGERLPGYDIKGCVFNDLGTTKAGVHIPYIIGTIIEGPRGGLYMLDAFNADRFVEYKFKRTERTETFLRDMCIHGKALYLTVSNRDFESDRDIKKLAREFKCTKALVRKEGLEILRSWDK